MSLVLSTAVHGPEIKLPLYLDDDLQYRFETGTAIGGPASGIYELVTTFRVDSDTAYTHGVEIYRADLRISGGGGSKTVVLKIAATQDSFESLLDEGRFYAAHLGPLVNESLVPICYGAFRVLNRQEEEQAFGCLVLQDCGRCIRHADVKLRDRDTNGRAENIRAGVLLAVFKLHKHGVVHGDLKFHHITLLNGRTPCIIDFTSAIAEHKCECIMSETQLWGIPEPLKDD
ncbi:hypothetical protein PENSPDRAFT_150931 [Peniophora sp. CONT]|nr:hypothetical protein PENSPDRAFT_150931 [Peniophora sp. CONT]